MYTEPTSVLNGRLPVISTSEPYSPIARAKLSATPEMIAGTRLGSTIARSTVSGSAPSEAAASSIDAVELDAAPAAPSARRTAA